MTSKQVREAATERKRAQREREREGRPPVAVEKALQAKVAAEMTSFQDIWNDNKPPTEKVKQENLVHLFESQEERLLRSIDWEDIKKAGLKDRALAIGIFHDKATLMRGKPTQILRIDDRTKFTEKFEVLMKEAVRRGLLEPGARPELPPGVIDAEVLPDSSEPEEPAFEVNFASREEELEGSDPGLASARVHDPWS